MLFNFSELQHFLIWLSKEASTASESCCGKRVCVCVCNLHSVGNAITQNSYHQAMRKKAYLSQTNPALKQVLCEEGRPSKLFSIYPCQKCSYKLFQLYNLNYTTVWDKNYDPHFTDNKTERFSLVKKV